MGWYGRRVGQRPEDLITASEVARFVYCPEAWRLEYGLGRPAANRASRDAGTRQHAVRAAAERLAGAAITLGWLALLAALALLVLGAWR